METFKFSLNRVRNYKSQVLDKEKKVLGALQRQRNDMARSRPLVQVIGNSETTKDARPKDAVAVVDSAMARMSTKNA